MEPVYVLERGLWLPAERMEMREETSLVVLHHTGGAAGEDPDAERINAGHRALGWVGIGYHYLIRKDGAIERGRPLPVVGAHVEGENYRSVGVALCGNFCEEEPTWAQIEAAAMLLAVISSSCGVPLDAAHIAGHRDYAATDCPGDALYERLPELIGKAAWYREQ